MFVVFIVHPLSMYHRSSFYNLQRENVINCDMALLLCNFQKLLPAD